MSQFITTSREETVALGRRMAAALPDGALIAFTGGLGAGKVGQHRGFPALDEVPGHHAHSQCVRAEGAAGLGKLVQVPAVERVIFTYDTGYIHLKVSE